jgi:hypothetical protein
MDDAEDDPAAAMHGHDDRVDDQISLNGVRPSTSP